MKNIKEYLIKKTKNAYYQIMPYFVYEREDIFIKIESLDEYEFQWLFNEPNMKYKI